MIHFVTWFSNNSLIIDTDKTRARIFHSNKTCTLVTPNIVCNDAEINYTSAVKFSGINISNNLKWNTHTQFVCSKLNKVFSTITSLRGDLSLFMLRNIHFEKYRSVLGYGTILWCGETDSVMVSMIQKSVLHSIDSIVGKFLKGYRFSQWPRYVSWRCWDT
jgi:hypothetical protein